ncbi:hypothetical protein [Brevundimonas pondensis]|nr:hypothetical protein [Brevundimonas pondensis]
MNNARFAGAQAGALLAELRLKVIWSPALTQLLRTRPRASTPGTNRPLPPPMKRLTPIEHARARGKTITMSMPDRGPEVRAKILAWLVERPGDRWFYAQGDNYAFETAADAAAFKQWLMSALAA